MIEARVKRGGWTLVGAALAVGLAGADARASDLTGEPLTASAAELRRAAKAAAHDEGSAFLLDEVVYRVEAGGVTTTRYRRIYTADTAAMVEAVQTFTASWSPWFEEAPRIDARVLDSRGQFHRLDPTTVERGTPTTGNSHMVSDRLQVRAPLPALSPGAIIEVVLTTREQRPLFAAGSVHQYWLGSTSRKIARSRVVIDAPAAMTLTLDEPRDRRVARRIEERGGRTRRTYEVSDLAPIGEFDYDVPGDVPMFPLVGLSTGRSWAEVAGSYGAIVRRQIAAGPLPAAARIARGANRLETIRRAADFVRRELRYTGLELGENEIAPWTPAQVWQRRYGDCKDLSTFLVALLAGAGVAAEVVLVDTGPGPDLRAALPGLGELDHAIVYVPAEKLWIDPTVELARPGQLSSGAQGRLAVIATASTRAPVRLPGSRAQDNTVVEERRILVPDTGPASVLETTRYGGLRELSARYDFRDVTPDQLQEKLTNYAQGYYGARRLARHRMSATDDVSKPLTIELTAEGVSTAIADEKELVVSIDRSELFQAVPPDLKRVEARSSGAAGSRVPAATLPRAVEPHTIEWRYTIDIPEGFEVVSLPSMEKALGPARLSETFTAAGGQVRGQLRFIQPRDRLTPAEAATLAKGVAAALAAPRAVLRFEHRATRMLERGDLVKGLADARRLVDARPRSAGRWMRYAYIAGQAGLAREAVAAAKKAVEAAPDEPWAYGTLAAALRRDPVGRMDRAGFDRPGAIAALTRASELAPDDSFYQREIGVLALRGDDGIALGGDARRAVRAFDRARELGETALENALLTALLSLGDRERLGQLAGEIEDQAMAGAFRLAAADSDESFRAALTGIPSGSRQDAVATFYVTTLQISDYPRVQRGVRLASEWLKATPALREMIGRLRRVPVEPRTPLELVARFSAESMLGKGERLLSREIAGQEVAASLRVPFQGAAAAGLEAIGVELTPQLWADFAAAELHVQTTRRAGPIEAVDFSADSGRKRFRWYVVHEGARGERLRLLGVGESPQVLAPAALRAVEAGRLAEARTLLDWAVYGPVAWRSLNFAGPQLSRFWTHGQRGDARRIRLAAAGLLVPLDPKRSLAILDRECPRARDLAEACRMARAAALAHADRFGEVAELTRGLAAAPDPSFLVRRIVHWVRSGAWSEIDALPADESSADAGWTARYARVASSLRRGQLELARSATEKMHAVDAGTPNGLHSVAFLYLFTDPGATLVARWIPELEAAFSNDDANDKGHLTLAAYYAVSGRHKDARDELHRAARALGRADPSCQLVVGRIAAAAGLGGAARRAYQEVVADPIDGADPVTFAELARRWSAALPR